MEKFKSKEEEIEYYKSHTTMHMVGNRAYFRLSPEAKKRKKREYIEANRERISAEAKARFEKNRERYSAKQKEYRERNKELIKEKNKKNYNRSTEERRKYNRKRLYGIDHETFMIMLANQNNSCGICNKPIDETAHIDHCHETDRIRGLLCSACNTGVGLLRDDISILNNAINYLNKHRKQI